MFTSADEPGIIYDLPFVSPESLAARKEDWQKVTDVWYKIVAYLQDDANFDEVLGILSARVGLIRINMKAFMKAPRF